MASVSSRTATAIDWRYDRSAWFSYFADHPFAPALALHLEGSYRRTLGLSQFEQVMLRPGLTLVESKRWRSFTAGLPAFDYSSAAQPVKSQREHPRAVVKVGAENGRMVDQASETSEPALRSLSNLIALECLFTLAGGYMDAYAFLAHGHVFANAQTGNVVLLAVSAAQADWVQAGRHIPPVIACSLGVAAAKLLGVQSNKHSFRATLICQTVELLTVVILILFGSSLPDPVVVPTLSFVAALQITSFDMLGPWSFNSAMTTGNLKTAIVGAVLWFKGENRPYNQGKAIVAAVACISFLGGALCGGYNTHRHPKYALLPCALLLTAGYLLTWQQHKKNEPESHGFHKHL